ncbi:MAG TPA: sigma-54-dependent Fis family transcriptional regulator [bacterium]|nr:sigma-54-dependent Fis family transcriptional regulator [bacterium]
MEFKKSDDPDLIGQSEAFLRLMESIRQVAPAMITVLIHGESGTGKEVVARALHRLSPRKDRPLLTVNCGAIPEGILESELFGHEKGAFTGAVESRKGYFELADGGTLFLDEIGEMPPGTQVKLLRVLEEQEFMRVGGNRMIRVDVRMIAATNKDLEKEVQRGHFRKDLFYRLNAVTLRVPPLRDRREDIRLLTLHFAGEICRKNHIPFHGFTSEAFHEMEEHDWPGNIRELRNVVERVLIFEKGNKVDGSTIRLYLQKSTIPDTTLPIPLHRSPDQAERELIYRALLDIRVALEDLKTLILSYRPRELTTGQGDASRRAWPRVEDGGLEDLSLTNVERRLIQKSLDQFRGNRRKAAKALGIGERTLYRKLKEYGLE